MKIRTFDDGWAWGFEAQAFGRVLCVQWRKSDINGQNEVTGWKRWVPSAFSYKIDE